MRWHVHGTDASTGNDVVLALDEAEATHAVQSAIAKRILVSHVTQDAGNRLRRALLPLACAALLLLTPLSAALYWQNLSIRAKLQQAVTEQTKLAQAIAMAEKEASTVRQNPLADVTRSAGIASQLDAARLRVAQMDSDLAAARQQITLLAAAANHAPELENRLSAATLALNDSQLRLNALSTENNAQRKRLQELQAALDPMQPAKIAELEHDNRALLAQVDLLKGQLLEAAAKSTIPAAAPETPEADPAPATTPRWALRVDFGAAAEFLALHSDKETVASTPVGTDGTFAWTGNRPANALTLRFLHDKSRERLYSAALAIALPSEGPRDKLAENQSIVLNFLHTFAPALKNPGALIASATAQLAGKDSAQRLLYLGEDHRLTVSQPAPGLFRFKIESPRLDADD